MCTYCICPRRSSRPPSPCELAALPGMERALIDYVAGVAGGVAVVVVGHPFDTTKTRLQTSPRGFYSGPLDCVRKTLSAEGLRGFYAGMLSPLVGQMVRPRLQLAHHPLQFFRAASFSIFHTSVQWVSGQGGSGHLRRVQPTNGQLMVAGGLTGGLISLIEVNPCSCSHYNRLQTPIDLVKTKLQIQIFSAKHSVQPSYSSVSGCLQYIVGRHGWRALWQGWTGTLFRNVPANALFFPGELVSSPFSC